MIRSHPASSLVVTALLAWSTVLVADPVISGSSSLTPATVGGGDVCTFAFTFSNADTPGSSPMGASQLKVPPIPIQVNGVTTHCDLLSVTAPGGSISYDAAGGFTVNHATLAVGGSRTVTARFQVPASGIENGGILQGAGVLTWEQAPGTLTSAATATLQASPSLQVSLGPALPSIGTRGVVRYRAEYQNSGTGVARRAWMVIPVDNHTRLLRVAAGSSRPQVWFSNARVPHPHPLEAINSDAFIREHFQPGDFALLDNGTPADPSDDFWQPPANTGLVAVLLDDPELQLLPSATGSPDEITWEVQHENGGAGDLIEQRIASFCDNGPFVISDPRLTLVRQLPADLMIFRSENSTSILFAGEGGKNYIIERSGDLVTWAGIGSAMEANPGFFIFSDTEPSPGKGFYRVAWIPEE